MSDLEIKKFNIYKNKWNVESETAIKPGLESIRKALSVLHNPQDKHKIIHVAGTNGKGSTIAFMREIAKEHGYTYGSFTSPSLIDVHDQIQLNGHNVTEAQMDRAFEKIYEAGLSGTLTDFELLTVVAFLVFQEIELDILFIEVGMGGRFDSTNVLKQSIGIIPSISIDHTNFLGETIEKITWHKAGILREHGKLLIGALPEDAKRIIFQEAADKKAEVIELAYDIIMNEDAFIYKDVNFSELQPSMLGNHQFSNMALGITALLEAGFLLQEEKVRAAVKNTSLLGRMEKVDDRTYMDGAHNLASISALVESVKKNFADKKVHFIVGMLKDKDYTNMLRKLEEVGTSFEFVRFHHERALSPEVLYNISTNSDKSITEKVEKISLSNPSENSVTIVTGSLYLITELRNINR